MIGAPAGPSSQDTEAAHVMPVRVYWEDTDAGGIVYHASYLRFMERGRTEFLRRFGVEQSRLAAETGQGFAVRRMAIEFLRPARLDDLLEVTTALAETGGASLVLDQAVLRGAEPLVTARVTVACVAGGRACRLPPALLAALREAG